MDPCTSTLHKLCHHSKWYILFKQPAPEAKQLQQASQ